MTQDEKMICHRCVGEEFLKAQIKKNGKRNRCSYCSTLARCFTMEQIGGRIEGAFDRHYIRTSQYPDFYQEAMIRDNESDYEWFRDGDPVVEAIMNAAELSEEAAQDIQEFLEDKYTTKFNRESGEESEFDSESYYDYRALDSAHWEGEWNDFERSLKTETRFFNTLGMTHLKAVFHGIENMATLNKRPAIVIAGPGREITGLYRARVFQSDEKLKVALGAPDQQLGTPPSMLATAGRMNAVGIPVFYGATDNRLAIAEVRPPVGSQVVVSWFEFTREVRLLDLTALTSISTAGSVFDVDYAPRLERAAFLRYLSARIMKPVLPDDAPYEYLPTQAISDYLAADVVLNLDGIIFSSSQVPGDFVNVVLFSKAAKVEEIALIEGSEVTISTEVWDEDGPTKFYQVVTQTPRKEEKKTEKLPSSPFGSVGSGIEAQLPVTLRIDLGSIKVHVVQAVQVTTEEHSVYRHQYSKNDFTEFGLTPPSVWE